MELRIPSNEQAEKSVLSHILFTPEEISAVVDVLMPEDFRSEQHALIFESMLTVYKRGRKPNVFNVKNELERRQKLTDAGGELYLEDLEQSVLYMQDIHEQIAEIKRTGIHRRLYAAAKQIADMALHQDDEALEQAEQLIYQIAMGATTNRVASMSDVMLDYIQDLETRRQNYYNHVANGVPTGFCELDRLIGALQPADLIILAARPSIGKTAAAVNIALNITKHARHVLFFSLEMHKQALAQRMVAMETPMDQSLLRDGNVNDDEMGQITSVAGQLAPLDFHIDDQTRTIAGIRSQARSMHAAQPLDLIVVDYLQLVKSSADGRARNETRTEEVAMISRSLKEIAMELNVPVLALAQLNRSIETRADKMPQLSDLKESGAIEQDADVIMFLHVNTEELEKRRMSIPYLLDIIVAKYRNGRIGQVQLQFRPRSTKFEDVPAPAYPYRQEADDDEL